MKKVTLLIICIVCVLTLVNCSPRVSSLPDVGFSLEGFNSDLEISLSDQWNTFKIGEDVTAYVTLKSDKEIEAPLDFNIQIYAYDSNNNEWNKVENIMSYGGDGPNMGPDLQNAVTSFHPRIVENNKKTVTIFFMIFGYEKIDGQITDNKIGAYAIFKMHP